jgi:hypothetical protein
MPPDGGDLTLVAEKPPEGGLQEFVEIGRQ